jgi:hypothetical protein
MADAQPRLPPSVTQPEAEAGTGVNDRLWSPLRVKQSIDALSPAGGGGGGWIAIQDIAPTAGGAVGSKVFQTASNDVLLSCQGDTLNLDVTVQASGPRVRVGGALFDLPLISGESHYRDTVSITVAGSGNVTATQILPSGSNGASMSTAYTYQTGPTVLTCTFTGGYPGSQTELKAGDTYQITGTTDAAATSILIADFGAFDAAEISVSGTAFTITGTIADRGTTTQDLPARVSAKNSSGSVGPTFDTDSAGTTDGVHRVKLNNTYPTATIGLITYPGIQQALKASEIATVVMTTANLTSILYTSPTGELLITGPTIDATPKTVQRTAGSYNDSTPNFQVQATRGANAAVTTNSVVVAIANVAPTITVGEPATRLRSGGNDGTSVQGHTITLTSDQQLLNAPTLNGSPGGGTFIGSWAGGPSIWTRTLQVHDNDVKGTYAWTGLLATGLAGLTTNTITGDSNYVLGGFVQRSVTFASFSQTAQINVEVITYTKLTAGIFTSTNQPSTRNPVQGNTSDLVDTYTVTALAANPTTVFWNDVAAASANSSGTAQLLDIEETV